MCLLSCRGSAPLKPDTLTPLGLEIVVMTLFQGKEARDDRFKPFHRYITNVVIYTFGKSRG